MTDQPKYKDHQAAINFSTEDDVLHGRISGINDLVIFEGISVYQLTNTFH